MATTSIWAVRDRLDRVLNYTSNPDKTETPNDFDYKYNGLSQAITYTTSDLKTAKQLYVSGLNCSLSTVKRDMQITKKRFRKEDGILAYHGYQSFLPNEVDAETAHQIGIELAQKLWGDRFEVLISTHLDKAHYHNHFVVNSISFKDGLRYYNNKSTYHLMRKTSDELCKKYALHVIKNPQYKTKKYAEWKKEPTKRDFIREDVDYAISHAMTMKQFVSTMERMGYKFKFNKHWAILPPNGQRYIRLRSLSDDGSYTQQAIRDRILEISTVRIESVQEPVKTKIYLYKGNLSKAKKITGFRALYFRYMYAMGILPKNAPNKRRVHFLLKEDLKYIDKITKEVTLLGKKKINTLDELESHLSSTANRLNKLIAERRCVYNKIRRCRDDDKKDFLKQEVATLSKEIKELREEVSHYENIKARSVSMKSKLEVIKEQEKPNERKEQEKTI